MTRTAAIIAKLPAAFPAPSCAATEDSKCDLNTTAASDEARLYAAAKQETHNLARSTDQACTISNTSDLFHGAVPFSDPLPIPP